MITLLPMTEAQLTAFLDPAIAEYARDHVTDGQWLPEEALELARRQFATLLPEGVRTPDHHLFTLVNEAGQEVGALWFAMQTRQGRPAAYVYDVRIREAFRRRGYASDAFAQIERRVRDLGGASIALHVFGHNEAAIRLYTKLGYAPTNLLMAKRLDPSG